MEPAPLREERKIVSILFVDLVGSTAAADGADPEAVRDVLRSYHARVKEELVRYGATVEKFIGDAVMAVFGAQQAHTDDPERAVRAGLRALDAVRAVPTVTGTRLMARAAVATGEAVVSVDTDGRSGEALAMGDVVNTAARLQSAAPENGLVVDDATMRATRRAVRYRTLDDVVAKGKSAPIPVYLAQDVLSPGAERRPGRLAPLVGREAELGQLLATWDRASTQRRPHLITVIGTAGVGKSRLAQEFASVVPARVLTGRCIPYEQSDVYGAFAQHVRHLARVADGDDGDTAAEKLDLLVDGLVSESERAEVRRCTAVLIGETAADPVAGETAVVLYSFRRLVEAAATAMPTVFVFEDVHWANPAEYDLIRYLVQYVRDVPVMFVALARPELLEAHPDWSSGLVAYSALPLEPLPDRDAKVIVEAVTGSVLASDDVDRLVNATGGNPLFLEELATAVLEGSGSLENLPTSVRAAIASRIDALPADARSVLLSAAVAGRAFWGGAVAAAIGSDVSAPLELLEQRDLLRRQPTSSVPGDVEYRFKHALIRDVGYATLPRAERARAHAAVAAYLVDRLADTDELAWLLAHHYEHAGDRGQAIRFLLAAAARAQAALAVPETLGLLDRAERLADDDVTRRRIRRARGRALTLFDEYDAGYEVLVPLLPSLDGLDLLEALLDLADCCHWTERTDEVITVAQRALQLARDLGREELAPPALARLSQGYAMRGLEGDLATAINIGEQALAGWQPDVRREDLADHQHLLGDDFYWAGDYARSLTLARAARDTAIDDPTSAEAMLRGTGMEAMVLAGLGRYDEALNKFEAVLALAHDMGRPRRVMTNYSTLLFRELFDLREARERSEWVLDGIPKTSFHMPWMNAEADLIHVDVLAAEWGAAQARWDRLNPQVVETRAWERWLLGAKLDVFRAEIALQTGNLELAAEWAMKATESARSSGRVKYEVTARDVLGRTLARLSRADEARQQFAAALEAADRLGNPHGRLLTHAHAAKTLYALGDDDAAAAHHATAQQVVDEVASSLPADRAETFRAAAPLPPLDDYR